MAYNQKNVDTNLDNVNFVINLNDDSESEMEEDALTINWSDEVSDSEYKSGIEEFGLEQVVTTEPINFEDEEAKLQAVLDGAAQMIVDIPSSICVPKHNCSFLKNNLMKGTSRMEMNKRLHMDNFTLVPFYKDSINFESIEWYKIHNLQINNIQNMIQMNPAKWIIEDYSILMNEREDVDPSLAEEMALHRKKEWISQINEEFVNVNVVSSFLEDHFYILELAYLKNSSKEKGLCGMTLTYCVNYIDTTRVIDIASIKLSTNNRNVAFGGFFDLMLANTDCPIYVYAPPQTLNIFNSTVFPWSAFFYAQAYRMVNLVNSIKLHNNNLFDVKTMCIDNKTHSNACSHCNNLNLLMCLVKGDYTFRNNPRHTPVILQYFKLPFHNITTCKNVKYLNYGDNCNSITHTTCMCGGNN